LLEGLLCWKTGDKPKRGADEGSRTYNTRLTNEAAKQISLDELLDTVTCGDVAGCSRTTEQGDRETSPMSVQQPEGGGMKAQGFHE